MDKFCSFFGESFDRQVDLTTENFDKIQFMIRTVCVFTLTASVDDLKTTWLQQKVDSYNINQPVVMLSEITFKIVTKGKGGVII